MTVLATFSRLCVHDLDSGIDALSACGIVDLRLRFGHASGLQLALVGDVLLLAGSEEILEPFQATDVTIVVDDLAQAIDTAQHRGATITRDVADQATGRNATLSFPLGPIIEFVEWNEQTRAAAKV